eukprot:135432-Rhodomonas_salina.1
MDFLFCEIDPLSKMKLCKLTIAVYSESFLSCGEMESMKKASLLCLGVVIVSMFMISWVYLVIFLEDSQ